MRNARTIIVPDTEAAYIADPATATASELSAAAKTFCNPRAVDDLNWSSHLAVGDEHRTNLINRANRDERNTRSMNRAGTKITFH